MLSEDNTTNANDNNSEKLEIPPPKKVEKSSNFYLKTTRSHCPESFIEKVDHGIFQSTNYNKKVFHNITTEERIALKEIKTWENCCASVQDKSSRCVVLLNEDYCLKVNTKIERGSFITLPRDVAKSFEKKDNGFGLKWENLKVLDKKRGVKYIRSSQAKPGSMYELIKTQKENNPARVITSGYATAIEFLSIFVEKYSYTEVDKVNSRIKDTSDMLDITDDIKNNNMITNSSILVSFDMVNMFPSINNISGLEAVSEILSNR